MKILLVEPNFPIPPKSKNHKNFLPIGLLKIASYLRSKNSNIKLVRGEPQNIEDIEEIKNFNPDEIWITSLFTYWAKYVKNSVHFYKEMFPKAKIKVGGIYASLRPPDEVKKFTGCDEVIQGVIPEAEKLLPAYDLLKNANPSPIDYQIIHASRGCDRKCNFCGTWQIEPEFIPEKSILNKITHEKIVFYDNNLLMNPHIESILDELAELKKKNQIKWCESQSGFDGRILLEKPYLAKKIKLAGFRDLRIAWDWKYNEHPTIKKQIDLLVDAGYPYQAIYLFVIYNWNIPFKEMEKKRIKCFEWKVQISDCRYRPLNQLFDNYSPRINDQTNEDYYIHTEAGWTDALIKQFRRNIRQQNICVRQGFPFYSKFFERKKVGREITRKVKELKNIENKIKFMDSIGADCWFPDKIKYPE